jgi:hypothetical protein
MPPWLILVGYAWSMLVCTYGIIPSEVIRDYIAFLSVKYENMHWIEKD